MDTGVPHMTSGYTGLVPHGMTGMKLLMTENMRSRHLLTANLILGVLVNQDYFMERIPKIHSTQPKKVIHSPKKELREFDIKGRKIMAYSRKDAIKRLKHRKNEDV